MSQFSSKHLVRILRVLVVLAIAVIGVLQLTQHPPDPLDNSTANLPNVGGSPAAEVLKTLPIKGRAPKTGYTREQFSDGWDSTGSCDVRNKILTRDMTNVTYEGLTCLVAAGTLNDPYTGKTIYFHRGPESSSDVQIDHVVAISDAWQKGAQQLSYAIRHAFANDSLELLAVDGPANNQKGDGDAATWLPSNKSFRCNYVARQIAVKKKYTLWITRSEYDAMAGVLGSCPGQVLPVS